MKATSRRLVAGTTTLMLALGGLSAPCGLISSASAHARAHRAAHSAAKRRGGERRVEGSLDYELAPAGSSLPATQTITLFLPGGVRVAGAKMPQCNPQALEKSGPAACPKGSSIGTGSATGWTLGQLWPLALSLYNGPAGNLLSYVTATSPVKIETVVEGQVRGPAVPTGRRSRPRSSGAARTAPRRHRADGQPPRARERQVGVAAQHELRAARALRELPLLVHERSDDRGRREPQLRLARRTASAQAGRRREGLTAPPYRTRMAARLP